jgi:DNA-binding PadR family transcriptional regulator
MMLVEPLHGYGVMQEVEAMTSGTVTIGSGTLYGAVSTLEKEGLIAMVRREERSEESPSILRKSILDGRG